MKLYDYLDWMPPDHYHLADTETTKTPTLASPSQRRGIVIPHHILGFSIVGGSVMVGGIALLFVLIQFLHVEQHLAYLVQAVASIETNFFLNRFFNWKERDGHLPLQWLKFHSTSAITFPLNQAIFALLTWLGVHYLLVTLIGVGIAAVMNYFANDRFVFHRQDMTKRETMYVPAIQPMPRYPHVGVIIPVRNAQRTIRGCLYSLFKQEYPGTISIFLVGNTPEQDTTWNALFDMKHDPRIHCIQIKRPAGWIGRDANMKRYCGCEAALSAGAEVLALLDSQVEAAPGWLEHGVGLLTQYHIDGVAGCSHRMDSDISLAGLYQDSSLVSEWPRFGKEFFLSQKVFRRAKGLPITNNLFLTKRVWQEVHRRWPLQAAYSWEDFRLVWEIVQAGYTICCTNTVLVYRQHQRKFRLVKHLAAGAGAVTFYQEHPDCAYVQRMLIKAGLVVGMLLALSSTLVASLILHNTLMLDLLGETVGLGYLLLAILSSIRARDPRGILFPLLDTVHILFWIIGAGSVAFRENQAHSGGSHRLAELLVAYR